MESQDLGKMERSCEMGKKKKKLQPQLYQKLILLDIQFDIGENQEDPHGQASI